MRLIRRHNRGAYRQPREHVAADADGTMAVCGTDVAQVRGDRRGAFGAGTVTSREVDEIGPGDYGICGRCRKAATDTPRAPKMARGTMRALYRRADAAGRAAATAHTPTPMHVVQRANPLDDTSPIVRAYEPVMDGACGFAWVTIRPGTSRFARWLKAEGLGDSAYRGGVSIWIQDYNQSYERKYTHAKAMAEVLREAGINAYADGRLD